MERAHYTVTGLVNNTSKSQVKNALGKLDGVEEVCVDLGRSSIEVVYNEILSEEEVRNCIEKTGFHIES